MFKFNIGLESSFPLSSRFFPPIFRCFQVCCAAQRRGVTTGRSGTAVGLLFARHGGEKQSSKPDKNRAARLFSEEEDESDLPGSTLLFSASSHRAHSRQKLRVRREGLCFIPPPAPPLPSFLPVLSDHKQIHLDPPRDTITCLSHPTSPSALPPPPSALQVKLTNPLRPPVRT